MLLLERLISLYAPHTCVECGAERDRLLCLPCRESIPGVPSRCYRCRVATRGFAVCGDCRGYTPLRHVYVAAHHEGAVRELLHRAKYERAQAGIGEMAEIMQSLLPLLPSPAALVPIPTASGRIRQRGYDQSVLLARQLSRHSGLPAAYLLIRFGQAHQVGAGRKERLQHLRGAFRVKGARALPRHVVLVDDVLTTGATIETAARALKKAGVRHVDAILFAQPS